jgi:hypothetical protein
MRPTRAPVRLPVAAPRVSLRATRFCSGVALGRPENRARERSGAHDGPSRQPSHRRGQRMARRRARWSKFADHPWSLINDHRGRPGSLPSHVSGPISADPRAPPSPGPCGIALAHGLSMTHEAVESGSKSRMPAGGESRVGDRTGSRSFGRQNCPRGLPGGWPSLRTASEIAIHMRASRRAVYAMAERTPLPRVAHVGRRWLVRRDDRLLSLDESRAASPGGTIELSLGDHSVDLTTALRQRF